MQKPTWTSKSQIKKTSDKQQRFQDDSICQKIEEKESFSMIELENGSQESSIYIAKNIRRTEHACSNNNAEACQHLANMCVLQNYRSESPSACTQFEKIINANPYKQWLVITFETY